MSVRTLLEKGSLRSLLRAFLVWLAAALTGCLLSACAIRAHAVNSSVLGYVSSALSFLCALLAGAFGAAGERRLPSGLLCGAGLSVLLLTLGFLIAGKNMDPSGILSVLSFTFAGCLSGACLFGVGKKETKHSSFQKRKKQFGKS